MPTIEFGSKAAADSVREQFESDLCPDDDKRLKTVRFVSDVPADVIERAEIQAADSLDDRSSGPGQTELTASERDRIDFSEGRASVPHARSVKGIAIDNGVDDWLAYYDPQLTVDEHRETMEDAAHDEQGKRMDAEDDAIKKAGRASRAAQSNECDHAHGHCEHGDLEACEFLTDRCGYGEAEIDQILAEQGGDEGELSGKQAGAYQRSLSGYKGAVATLRELIEAVREQRRHAEQAWAAMAAIRREKGEDVEEPEKLHDLLADMEDALDAHQQSTLHEDIATET